MSINERLLSLPKRYQGAIILVGLVILVGILTTFYRTEILSVGVDFHWITRPAAQYVLHGHSPYNMNYFLPVPWAIIPVLPFAVFPEELGAALYAIVCIAIYTYVALRLGADKLGLIIFLVSPPVILDVMFGNLNSWTLLGLVLPPWLGLFFVAIKPQIGLGIGLFWLVEAWRKGGLKDVVKTFAPVTIALALSILVYGFWWSKQYVPVNDSANASLWPWSIPLGLFLLEKSIRERRMDYGIAASPFISPYLTYPTFVAGLIPLIKKNRELFMVAIGMYIVGIVRLITGF